MIASRYFHLFSVGDAVWWHDPEDEGGDPSAGYVVSAHSRGRFNYYHVVWFDGSGGVGRARPRDLTLRDAPGPVPDAVREHMGESVTLTRAQKEYRSQKIAVMIRARVQELKLSQVEVARRAGIHNVSTFRNAVLRYASREPDLRQLGMMSLALQWPVQYLPGLLDGSIDLSDDPANLPEAKAAPAQRKWKTPATWGTELPNGGDDGDVRPGGLRRDVDALTVRVAELEGIVVTLLDALRMRVGATDDV